MHADSSTPVRIHGTPGQPPSPGVEARVRVPVREADSGGGQGARGPARALERRPRHRPRRTGGADLVERQPAAYESRRRCPMRSKGHGHAHHRAAPAAPRVRAEGASAHSRVILRQAAPAAPCTTFPAGEAAEGTNRAAAGVSGQAAAKPDPIMAGQCAGSHRPPGNGDGGDADLLREGLASARESAPLRPRMPSVASSPVCDAQREPPAGEAPRGRKNPSAACRGHRPLSRVLADLPTVRPSLLGPQGCVGARRITGHHRAHRLRPPYRARASGRNPHPLQTDDLSKGPGHPRRAGHREGRKSANLTIKNHLTG